MLINKINGFNTTQQTPNRSNNHTTAFSGKREFEIVREIMDQGCGDVVSKNILKRNPDLQFMALMRQIKKVLIRTGKGDVKSINSKNKIKLYRQNGSEFGNISVSTSETNGSKILKYYDKEIKKRLEINIDKNKQNVIFSEISKPVNKVKTI